MHTRNYILLIVVLLFNYQTLLAQTVNIIKKEWPALPKALDEGRFDDAKKYLGKNKNPYFREKPLIVFFADNNNYSRDIIKFLIDHDINKKHYGEALIRTVSYSDFESVKRLLAAGADINTKTKESDALPLGLFNIKTERGRNSLFFAKNQIIAKYLIDNGIKVDEDSIFTTAYNNFPLLRTLDDAGFKGPDMQKEEAGKYLLIAARLGDAQAVKYFMSKGADINVQSPPNDSPSTKNYDHTSKSTPLIINAFQGYSETTNNIDTQVSPDIAKILIAAGADINVKDDAGKTALHYTCNIQISRIFPVTITFWNRQLGREDGHGHPSRPIPLQYDMIGEVLINAGADINATDNEGNTPLILAVKNNRYGMVKRLLKAGADADVKNDAGEVAFNFASDYKSIAAISEAGHKLKLSKEFLNTVFRNIFQDYFFRQGMKIDKEAFNNLITIGADINTIVGNKDQNALIYQIENARNLKPEEAELPLLLNLAIDLNAKSEGQTALMYAAERERFSKEYTSLLLQYGADVNIRNANLATALTIARSEKNMDTAALLEAAGAIRDINSEWWHTLYKEGRKDVSVLKTLISDGADINAQTTLKYSWQDEEILGDSITALMYLAKRWCTKSVKDLIKMGAKADIKDKYGMTVLHHAAGGPQGWRYMRTSTGSIHINDINEMIPLLIKADADVNAKDNEGKTAKDYAEQNHMLSIAETLSRYTK